MVLEQRSTVSSAFDESENVNTIQRYQLRMRRWMESLSRQMLDNDIREL